MDVSDEFLPSRAQSPVPPDVPGRSRTPEHHPLSLESSGTSSLPRFQTAFSIASGCSRRRRSQRSCRCRADESAPPGSGAVAPHRRDRRARWACCLRAVPFCSSARSGRRIALARRREPEGWPRRVDVDRKSSRATASLVKTIFFCHPWIGGWRTSSASP